jgi:hypothetical protein
MLIDLRGQKFGKLTVVSRAPQTGASNSLWLCQCECGKTTVTRSNKLRGGYTRSCGCYVAEVNTKHGMHLTPTYSSWRMMLQRCTNPKSPRWNRYGGRGISVCARWRDFEKFLADMGVRPAGTTLDRFPDPDGNYQPGNCRWGTKEQQYSNRSKVPYRRGGRLVGGCKRSLAVA